MQTIRQFSSLTLEIINFKVLPDIADVKLDGIWVEEVIIFSDVIGITGTVGILV